MHNNIKDLLTLSQEDLRDMIWWYQGKLKKKIDYSLKHKEKEELVKVLITYQEKVKEVK